MYLNWAFQGGAVPISQGGGCVIGAYAKIQKSVVRRRAFAHILVWQEKFRLLWAVVSRCGTHGCLFESGWLRSGVRVKRGVDHAFVSRPETHAAHFMRIGLARDQICSGTFRGAAAGESRHG